MSTEIREQPEVLERILNEGWPEARSASRALREYGWQPLGTEVGQWCDPETGELCKQLSTDPDEWDGTYFCNESQWVTEEDAANIADALERVLEDKPNFKDGVRQRIRDFIAFCRVGEFTIG